MKLKRLITISPRERTMLLHAWSLCLWFGLLARVLPMRRFTRLLEGAGHSTANQHDGETIRLVKLTLRRIERHSPLLRFNCLARAAVCKVMLGRYGIASQMALGVRLTKEEGMAAHAFVLQGGQPLYGYKPGFTEVHRI